MTNSPTQPAHDAEGLADLIAEFGHNMRYELLSPGLQDRVDAVVKTILGRDQTLKDQAAIEARINENELPRNFHIDEGHSEDFHKGFRAALEQCANADNIRIKELKQQKESL